MVSMPLWLALRLPNHVCLCRCQQAVFADGRPCCGRPLETAEENARRLTGNAALTLPHPECCETNKATLVECPNCDVSSQPAGLAQL